jgi:hypothetical protein
MSWVGHTEQVGNMGNGYWVWKNKIGRGRNHFEYLGVDAGVILKWILGRMGECEL